MTDHGMTGHVTDIVTEWARAEHRADCTCGWSGPWRREIRECSQDISDHWHEARQADGGAA